jgi:FkbM family methyltransferase
MRAEWRDEPPLRSRPRFMSRFDRAVGLARSIAIYQLIPLRQRRLRRLYGQFVAAGDLVFDVGAHAGNRTRAFASLGCRVLALEPQPDFARLLRVLFSRSPRVQVLQLAASEQDGRITLAVSERTPTVTTLDDPWRRIRSREPGFAGVEWNRQIEIESARLDTLIERFGVPAFVKMDVEGSELRVLNGLSRPLAALSFEYLPTALPEARACVARIAELGEYRYNVSVGESYRLISEQWLSAAEALTALESPHAQTRAGDVYARLATARA